MGKPYRIPVTAFTIARNSTFPAFSTQRLMAAQQY